MKLLLLLLLLIISCAKEVPTAIRKPVYQEPVMDRLESAEVYTTKIDVMVAFLWPAKVTTSEQRASIRGLIRRSRELKELQDGYFRKKLELSRAWRKKECDCVLNGLCGETVPETPYEECEALEADIFTNERALPGIYEVVEKMKADVKDSGGEWLKTHSDFPEGPVSEMDFEHSVLKLPVFAPQGDPVSYEPVSYTIRQTRYADVLKAQFADKEGRGQWEMELSVQRTEEALKLQGKLFLKTESASREGIIYWMNPVIL